MAEKNSLFRKSALDKLASPERLDVLMQVTSPQGWLALVTIAVVLVAAITWSIIGRLPETVVGDGMVILGGGNRVITASGGGKLAELNISVGSEVAPGDVVAVIAVAATPETLATGQATVRDAERERNRVLSDTAARKSAIESNIASLQGELELTRNRLAVQEQVVREAEAKLAQQLIARRDYQAEVNARDALVTTEASIQRSISPLRVELEGLDGNIARAGDAVNAARRDLALLEAQIEARTEVPSPFAGRVVSVPIQINDVVAPGDMIAAVGESDATLQAAMFVAEDQAGQIEVGMPVELDFLRTHRRQDVGVLKGTVAEIGQIGATTDEVVRVMGSSGGAQRILDQGATRLVRVTLEVDPATASGYAWTMSGGPNSTLVQQTPVLASIEYDSRRPITHVVPKRAIDAVGALWERSFGG